MVIYHHLGIGFDDLAWAGLTLIALFEQAGELLPSDIVRTEDGKMLLTWPAPIGISDASQLTDIVERADVLGNWQQLPDAVLEIVDGFVRFTDLAPPENGAFYRKIRP